MPSFFEKFLELFGEAHALLQTPGIELGILQEAGATFRRSTPGLNAARPSAAGFVSPAGVPLSDEKAFEKYLKDVRSNARQAYIGAMYPSEYAEINKALADSETLFQANPNALLEKTPIAQVVGRHVREVLHLAGIPGFVASLDDTATADEKKAEQEKDATALGKIITDIRADIATHYAGRPLHNPKPPAEQNAITQNEFTAAFARAVDPGTNPGAAVGTKWELLNMATDPVTNKKKLDALGITDPTGLTEANFLDKLMEGWKDGVISAFKMELADPPTDAEKAMIRELNKLAQYREMHLEILLPEGFVASNGEDKIAGPAHAGVYNPIKVRALAEDGGAPFRITNVVMTRTPPITNFADASSDTESKIAANQNYRIPPEENTYLIGLGKAYYEWATTPIVRGGLGLTLPPVDADEGVHNRFLATFGQKIVTTSGPAGDAAHFSPLALQAILEQTTEWNNQFKTLLAPAAAADKTFIENAIAAIPPGAPVVPLTAQNLFVELEKLRAHRAAGPIAGIPPAVTAALNILENNLHANPHTGTFFERNKKAYYYETQIAAKPARANADFISGDAFKKTKEGFKKKEEDAKKIDSLTNRHNNYLSLRKVYGEKIDRLEKEIAAEEARITAGGAISDAQREAQKERKRTVAEDKEYFEKLTDYGMELECELNGADPIHARRVADFMSRFNWGFRAGRTMGTVDGEKLSNTRLDYIDFIPDKKHPENNYQVWCEKTRAYRLGPHGEKVKIEKITNAAVGKRYPDAEEGLQNSFIRMAFLLNEQPGGIFNSKLGKFEFYPHPSLDADSILKNLEFNRFSITGMALHASIFVVGSLGVALLTALHFLFLGIGANAVLAMGTHLFGTTDFRFGAVPQGFSPIKTLNFLATGLRAGAESEVIQILQEYELMEMAAKSGLIGNSFGIPEHIKKEVERLKTGAKNAEGKLIWDQMQKDGGQIDKLRKEFDKHANTITRNSGESDDSLNQRKADHAIQQMFKARNLPLNADKLKKDFLLLAGEKGAGTSEATGPTIVAGPGART